MARPSPVTRSAGSRIKVSLGSSGDDYLYLVDETTGSSEWQSRGWTIDSGGLPCSLAKQLNACSAKDRYVTDVAFGPDDEWYVHGKKRDGSGAHGWWGGTTAGDSLKELISKPQRLQVSFGDSGRWAFVHGSNGHGMSGNVDDDLQTRVARIHQNTGTINCMRLLPDGGYFISDSEGTAWKGAGIHLGNELKSGGKDAVLDVAVASDGQWIVIRPERYCASTGVSDALKNQLTRFYREHKQRSQKQAAAITQYDAQKQREQVERAAQACRQEEQRQAEQRAQAQCEKEKRDEAERKARLEERMMARRAEIERETAFQHKRLKVGTRVTEVGRSSSPGDATIVSMSCGDGVMLRRQTGVGSHITDPQLLTLVPFEPVSLDDTHEEMLIFTMDKYEAAVSVYHCECSHGICSCEKVATFAFQSAPMRALPLLTNLRTPFLFDEYKCAEKIDLGRLKRVIADLEADAGIRNGVLKKLQTQLLNAAGVTQFWLEKRQAQLKSLQRCTVLELTAKTLAAMLKDLVPDNDGCVEHEVNYQHKSASYRGRLFAIGEEVRVKDEKFPRTATLQGMANDLRSPLVGAFAHDIDCANSEFQLICSLANQLGLSKLVPTFFKYCDNRKGYHQLIERLHSVSEDEAKRLPNIIINGGQYRTWLRKVSKPEAAPSSDKQELMSFVFGLSTELRALRNQLLQLPRFGWASIEKQKIMAEGKSEAVAVALLLPRIVQDCENQVLGLMHRSFFDSGWDARAKVFDGLIVEGGILPDTFPLDVAMRRAEEACRARGWDISLVEKPLHSLQDAPIRTISEARQTIAVLRGSSA